MLIPGMTRRTAHEFEEYRPYTSLAQFDKEIGKYVKPDEVARLRSYVVLEIISAFLGTNPHRQQHGNDGCVLRSPSPDRTP